MSNNRYLIVNADDFGLSAGVNRGIIEAHENGIVTSASLMVHGAAATEAAAYARAHDSLSVGLHIDLGEWVYRDGSWVEQYHVVATDDLTAVADEVSAQVERFRQLLGGPPTHLDSHQHVHRSEPTRSLLLVMARTLDVPLRHLDRAVSYRGDFYGQTGKGEPIPQYISVASLIKVIHELPPGITELGCHPGFAGDSGSVYNAERALEVATLCDPRVREAIERERIALCSFGSLDRELLDRLHE
jgi:predicted glycoside hydrolase/deacetylase ChbG (UPF0249 family)